ncbi:retrovirus-related Pol polyprotein from transposon 412 [Trichonephila clavata]|uniref:Retrovirus-related Pol polyprotein from transposon 412 n=1 Tax=Trichonephila clavata TaxID=2740835 RepID=A0A8X6HB46_TRICU|nr:retrovirus-related Pol polyprotein from transposon 412 [Trichonephila clavata]
MEECEVVFTSLKEALTSAPILSYPGPDKQFILDTDASHANVGAVLSQEIDGQERVIAYWSKCLSKPERNYCFTRKNYLPSLKLLKIFTVTFTGENSCSEQTMHLSHGF